MVYTLVHTFSICFHSYWFTWYWGQCSRQVVHPHPPPLTGSYYIMEPTVALKPWSWLLEVVHQAQKPSFSDGELKKREGDEETGWRSLAIEGWATLINSSALSFLPLSRDVSRLSPPFTFVAVCTWIKRKKYHKIIKIKKKPQLHWVDLDSCLSTPYGSCLVEWFPVSTNALMSTLQPPSLLQDFTIFVPHPPPALNTWST